MFLISGQAATPAPVVCKNNEFSCVINDKSECVPKAWQCDGFRDCSDGADELGCAPVTNPGTTPGQNTGKCEDNEVRNALDTSGCYVVWPH